MPVQKLYHYSDLRLKIEQERKSTLEKLEITSQNLNTLEYERGQLLLQLAHERQEGNVSRSKGEEKYQELLRERDLTMGQACAALETERTFSQKLKIENDQLALNINNIIH